MCGDTCFERLLTIRGMNALTTVVSYRCVTNGHIFFVRKADVDAPVSPFDDFQFLVGALERTRGRYLLVYDTARNKRQAAVFLRHIAESNITRSKRLMRPRVGEA